MSNFWKTEALFTPAALGEFLICVIYLLNNVVGMVESKIEKIVSICIYIYVYQSFCPSLCVSVIVCDIK